MNPLHLNGYRLTQHELLHGSAALDAALASLPEQEQQVVREFLQQWFDPTVTTIAAQTSGSTGPPKTILLSRRQLLASAAATADYFDFKAGQRALLPLSVRFIAGKMMLVRAWLSGLQLQLVPPSNNPLEWVDPALNFDFAVLVPLQLEKLLAQQQLHRFGKLLLGGADLPPQLKKAVVAQSVPVYQGFGMTETVSHIALRRLNGPQPDEGYRALPGIRLSVDERSCLRITGPATDHSWVQSNDLVTLLAADRFLWRGRYDLVINSAGIKVALEEIESRIYELIPTNDCFDWLHGLPLAVGSMPHPRFGETAALWVEGGTPTEDERVRSLLCFKEFMPLGWAPNAVFVVHELPRLPSGKIDRKSLRAPYNSL